MLMTDIRGKRMVVDRTRNHGTYNKILVSPKWSEYLVVDQKSSEGNQAGFVGNQIITLDT